MKNKEIYEQLHKDTLNRYRERFYKEGETPKALGWGCKEDQLERFKTLCENIDLAGKSILDLGCGFADLYGYLLSKKIECQYIGVDVIPEFIESCKRKYDKGVFLQGDILLDNDKLPQADVVITLGTLNKRLDIMDNLIYTENFMRQAFLKAKEAFVMDFLSTHLTKEYPKEEFVYYHDPKEVLDMAFELTDDVKLLHNYRPIPQRECMLFMYKMENKHV